MLLLLPLILASWCFYKRNPHMIPDIFTGLISAVLVCGFRAFFLYSHRVIPYSFELNMWYLLLRQSLLPVIVLYGVFFLISKDTISYKIEALFPLLISFYLIYLPYTILSGSEKIITTFPLFIKPTLFTVMIFSLGLSAKHIEKTITAKKHFFAAIWIITAVVSIVFPSVVETMYILDMSYFLILVLSGIFCATLPILFILSRLGVFTVRDKE